MNISRHLAYLAVVASGLTPCFGQEVTTDSQPAATVTGTGKPNYIPIWRSASVLGSSGIYSTSGNVGVGTSTPVATLEVNGNAQVDGNFSLSGSILENGAGQLIWAPDNGSDNFSVGLGAMPSTTTGVQNTALGFDALNVNGVGYANTAVGFLALLNNTSGNYNTAVGVAALDKNINGTGNTAVGGLALWSNTSGVQDAALGQSALYSNTSGDANTATGYFSLWGNTSGSTNTASGFGALSNNTTGSNNIAMGSNAGAQITTTSNNIEIGNQGVATDSGAIRIGTEGTQGSAFIAGIYGASTGLPGVPVVVDANGNLGTVSSSRRYKEDIQDMGEASGGLMRLRPVTFRYSKAYEDGSKPVQYGLIAEEVAEVYPDLVAGSADGRVETVKYQLLDPMLLNELQKQHAKITAQQEQIRSLEERLARIEAALGTAPATTAAR